MLDGGHPGSGVPSVLSGVCHFPGDSRVRVGFGTGMNVSEERLGQMESLLFTQLGHVTCLHSFHKEHMKLILFCFTGSLWFKGRLFGIRLSNHSPVSDYLGGF